jgi:hypothetical protein
VHRLRQEGRRGGVRCEAVLMSWKKTISDTYQKDKKRTSQLYTNLLVALFSAIVTGIFFEIVRKCPGQLEWSHFFTDWMIAIGISLIALGAFYIFGIKLVFRGEKLSFNDGYIIGMFGSAFAILAIIFHENLVLVAAIFAAAVLIFIPLSVFILKIEE